MSNYLILVISFLGVWGLGNNLKVGDNVPTASCMNTDLYLDQNGVANLAPSDVDNGSVIPPDHTLIVSPNAFNCKHVGNPQTVTLSIIDRFGGVFSSCTALVSVIDTISPKVNCISPALLLGSDGVDTLTMDLYSAAVGDNCGIDTVIITPNIFSCNDIGTTQTIVVEVRDINGNTASCTDMVSIADKLPPTITCPANYTAELNASGQAFVSPFFLVTVADNCGIPSFPLGGQLHDCTEVGQSFQVTYSSTDGAGNTANCTMNYTIADNLAPIVTCKNLSLNVGQTGSITIDPTDVEDGPSTDNCGILSKSVVPNTFSCSDAGINNVILTVEDVNGNITACTTTVEVLCTTLPIELSYFEVFPAERGVLLEWATLSEINNDYFEVEHSSDGLDFQKIGNIKGAGNSFEKKQYKFRHETPLTGANYYRIQQVDFDGTSTYSPVRHLSYQSKKTGQLIIYPNPATDFIFYNLEAANLDVLEVSVYNSSGYLVSKGTFGGKIPIKEWPAGLYWIRVDNGRSTQQQSFVINKSN